MIDKESSALGLLCYLLFWIIQFNPLMLSPHKIRWLFFVRGIIVPICWLAMVIWTFVCVLPSTGLFTQHVALSGNQLSWGWLSALNSALGVYATLSVNIPDFTVRTFYILDTGVLMSACKTLCQEQAGVSNLRDPSIQRLIIFQRIHSGHLRTYRGVGTLPMGNIGEVHPTHHLSIGVPISRLYSAEGFLNFMNGYAIFLGPFAGIMVTDVHHTNTFHLSF